MTDNQEPKSQSEDTKFPMEIEALLQPHRAIIQIPTSELRKRFDDFFHAYEAVLVAKYKVKGRRGKGGKVKNAKKILEKQLGVNNLYHDVLAQVLRDNLPEVFFVEGFRLSDFSDDEETAPLVAKFYYYPELELNGDIDYVCENPVMQDEEAAWEDRCRELQHQHKYNEEYTEDSLDADNLEVLLDLIVSDDQYTLRRKWLELTHLPSSLQEEIRKHKKGDLFETKYLAPNLSGGDGADELDAHIKIYDVRTLIRPEVDDELAKKAGFDSLQLLRNQFQADYDQYVEQAQAGVAFDHIVEEMLGKCKLPQIPNSIIEQNAESRLSEHLRRCKDDKQMAMKVVGVSKWGELEAKFRASVIHDILRDLAARKYAEMHDLPVKEKILMDHMVSQIEWVERKLKETVEEE